MGRKSWAFLENLPIHMINDFEGIAATARLSRIHHIYSEMISYDTYDSYFVSTLSLTVQSKLTKHTLTYLKEIAVIAKQALRLQMVFALVACYG